LAGTLVGSNETPR